MDEPAFVTGVQLVTDGDGAADYKAPDADGWIEHDGKGMPVPPETLVEVIFGDGPHVYSSMCANGWQTAWTHKETDDASVCIVRYRIKKPTNTPEGDDA